MKNYIHIVIITFLFCFSAHSQEPIQLNTETEDIALTDDINIARAQVTKYPDNPEAHFNLAIALSHTSYVEDAIKELRKTKILIRKKENNGLIDNKINEYKEMLRLRNDEESVSLNNIRYRLAFSHYLKAYLITKEIEKTKKRLLSIDKNPEIKENLELSTYYFKELLKLNPKDEWAKVYYAFILAEQMGEINNAKNLWDEVTKEFPNNPAPYFFLGELNIKEGNLKEGLQKIAKAILLRSAGN